MRLSLILLAIVIILSFLVVPARTIQSVCLPNGLGGVGDRHIIDTDAVVKAEILEVKTDTSEESYYELH